MATSEELIRAQKVTVGLFNAALGQDNLAEVESIIDGGASVEELADILAAHPLFVTGIMGLATTPATQAAILLQHFGLSAGNEDAASADAIAEGYFVSSIEAGVGFGALIIEAVDYLDGNIPATFTETANLLANKALVGATYSESESSTDLSDLQGVLAGLSGETLLTQEEADAIVAGNEGSGSGDTFRLTTNADFFVDGELGAGTSGDDTYKANVVQNVNGVQVNSLGSGDEIDGGAGNDMLAAKVMVGSTPGEDFETSPIQAETTDVETIQIEAVNSDINGNNSEVYINAKDMFGVDKISSNYSDANLTVQNLTTLADDGVTARELSTMTVGMEYTGNADSRWDEADTHVYFDQDYLNPSVTRTNPSVDFRLMNEDAFDETTGAQPLGGVYIERMDIQLNGETFEIAPFITEDPAGTGLEIATYDDLLDAVTDAVVLLKADNLDNAALQTLEVTNGGPFTSDISPVTGQLRVGTTVVLTVDGDTNGTANTLTVTAPDLVLDPTTGSELENSNRFERAGVVDAVVDQVLSINIDLEKAGLAGDGGELIVGSMFKDGTNTFSDLYDGKGIDQFDVTVYGGDDKPSSLSSLSSTGNNLRTVNVTTDEDQADTYASLTIGNSESGTTINPVTAMSEVHVPTSGNESVLKDVQTFDASGLMGDLTLYAGLSEEVTAKYLDRTDDAFNPAADNVAFEYTGGTGNDYINLNLDASNLAGPGTSSREDLTLSVNGGDSDDTLITNIEDTTPANVNWYENQKINADIAMLGGAATGQLEVNGDAGNDSIHTFGAGDMAINGGSGDDAIYVDNTGASATIDSFDHNNNRAAWVVNDVDTNGVAALGHDVDDLLSQDASTTTQTNVVNLHLTVEFNGFESTVEVGGTTGSTTGVTITDLVINQAIKDAINNNDVLNELLIAQDGPARTLIIDSLIDDVQVEPVISLSSDALTAGQVALGAAVALISNAQANALGFDAASSLANAATAGGRFDPNNVDDTVDTATGAPSAVESDNLIVAGTGDDVIVLGTGAESNDTLGYSGFANGTDYIVNFSADDLTTTTTTTSSTATGEIYTVTFGNDGTGVGAAQTILLAGITGTVSDNAVTPTYTVTTTATLDSVGAGSVIPGVDVAENFASTLAGSFSVVSVDGASVTIQHTGTGDLEDLEAADFTGTYDGTITLSKDSDGSTGFVAPVFETFTIDFDGSGATATGTFTFDGATIDYAVGDGLVTLAAAFAAGTYDNYDAVDNLDGTVTFTANVEGDLVEPVTGDFTADNIVDAVSAGTDGVLGVGTQTITQVFGGGSDHIDFSSYNVEHVEVDGVTITGTDANANDEVYIAMTESTTNDGEYLIELWEFVEGADPDVLVDTVGIADFGVEQAFIDTTFII